MLLRLFENPVKHLPGQLPGKGVLLTGVVGGDDGPAFRQGIHLPVAEFQRRQRQAFEAQILQKLVESHLTQGNEYPNPFQQV